MDESCVRVRPGAGVPESAIWQGIGSVTPRDWCGRTLGRRYRLMQPVGLGGSAVVFAARDLARRERVAVKVLPLEPSDRTGHALLPLHTQVALSLCHPHLVQMRAAGRDGRGVAYLVMEMLEGITLAEHLRAHVLSPAEVLALLLPIAQALAYVHARGVVHRDVKPGNIMLCRGQAAEGVVPKLIDFGIAQARASRLPYSGSISGTPAYMSPEQARGEALGYASDVWSLGVVLFEALSGRLPFEAESSTGVLLSLVHGRAPKLSHVAPHVPRALAQLVDRALDPCPHQRPADAQVFAEALFGVSAPWELGISACAAPIRTPVRATEEREKMAAYGSQDTFAWPCFAET